MAAGQVLGSSFSMCLLVAMSLFVPKVISAFVLPINLDPSLSENPNKAFLETMEYLARFGYLSVDSWKAPTKVAISAAMINLQSFMDVLPTGTLDMKTLEVVRTPRCGLKDPVNDMDTRGVAGAEHTRYGLRWNKTDLTYRIFKFPPSVKKGHFRKAVKQACQQWSDVTPLSFREVNRKVAADIDIRFYSGYHNDEFPFDNTGGVVGHPVQAVDELGGPHVVRLDLDADENFTFDSSEGINLFQIMVHQIGHALGLGHSSVHDSIMSPCTKPYNPDLRLTETDITGIQAIYGSPDMPTASIEQAGPLLPSAIIQQGEPRYLCAERPLDAVAVLAGEIYVFKGNRYWQFQSPNDLVSPRSGSLMTDRWPGLPSGLDAVYQRQTDAKAVFVKSGRMYIFDVHPKTRSSSTVSYTQIQLRDLRLPRSIDAAMTCPTWPKSTYFIKRGKVWHYSDQTETIMAGPLQVQELWSGLPSKKMDAAFTHNGHSYVVRDVDYWKIDHSSNQVEPGYPRNFHTDFLGC